MGDVRQFKKRKDSHCLTDPSWFHGFEAGAKQQREADIRNLADMLNDLETIPGIGEFRAWQIRKHFMSKFGIREE